MRFSLKIKIDNEAIKKTTLARTLANAAPLIPNAGNPNQPKIKMGSKTALITAVEAINTEGVLASPPARNTAFPIMGITKKIPPQ